MKTTKKKAPALTTEQKRIVELTTRLEAAHKELCDTATKSAAKDTLISELRASVGLSAARIAKVKAIASYGESSEARQIFTLSSHENMPAEPSDTHENLGYLRGALASIKVLCS